jgi:hypothetical protein
MATTTNFGFEIPDDTDLVKDGALAMRTLGQEIDTTFASVGLNEQTGATYTAVLADGLNKVVTMDNAGANDFLIPTDASVAFPTGTVLNVYCKGAGTTTIKAVTPGTTTITSAGAASNAPTLETKKAGSCVKIAANAWIVVGGIA